LKCKFVFFDGQSLSLFSVLIIRKFGTGPTLSALYSGATAGKIGNSLILFLIRFNSGALATIITHPFDTVKSMRQVRFDVNQSQTSDRTIEILRKMLREQGIRSWYKGNTSIFIIFCIESFFLGLVPRLLKVSPACAIMISTIEFFREHVFK
jgi:hypothetical protein